jgi:hypothetical protein
LLQNQYTYKYIAQSRSTDTYGSDAYGAQEYSCANNDQICLAGGPGAPNTGFLVSSNPVLVGGIFITAALVITVVVYAILRKVKQPKAGK